MRRGRPLLVWGGALALMLLWLGLRLPMLAQQQRALVAMLSPPTPRPALPPAPALAPRAPLPPLLARLPPAPPGRPRRAMVPQPPSLLHPAAVMPAPAPLQTPLLTPLPAPLPAPTPPPASVALPPPDPAFALASAGYARLAAGQRRQAAALLDAALALAPANRQWRADRAALGRRWQLGGFALLREAPVAAANAPGSGLGAAAASPVLGGGQYGASIAYLPDPLARRPLALVARANVAAGPGGVAADTAQLALGLRQALLPGVSIAAERLVPLGPAARGDWTVRLAGGATAGRFSLYGEGGVLGRGDVYAGAQASARLLRIGPVALAAGSWASLQGGTPDVWRVDVGPTLSARVKGVRIEADWRQRVAGNAAPGSGPVLTIAAGF